MLSNVRGHSKENTKTEKHGYSEKVYFVYKSEKLGGGFAFVFGFALRN